MKHCILCLLCVIALNLPAHAQLKPNTTEVLVQMTVFLPDGKPLKNETFRLIRMGARYAEYPLTTNDKGFCEILLQRGLQFKVDFRGKARPKTLLVPNEPNKTLKLDVKLDRYQEGNMKLTVHYLADKTINLVNEQKKVVATGKTDKDKKVMIWAMTEEKYTIEIPSDSISYPIFFKPNVRGDAFGDDTTTVEELVPSEYDVSISRRATLLQSSWEKQFRTIVKRNRWTRELVIFTGGWFDDNFEMYQKFKEAQALPDTSIYVFASHCAICEKSDIKNIKANPIIKHVGIRENDIESILSSLKFGSKTRSVVLVSTRNGLEDKEVAELQKIKLPVHVVSLHTEVAPSYLTLARLTKGSVHTLDADVTIFSKMKEGEVVEINGQKYRLKGKGYELVK